MPGGLAAKIGAENSGERLRMPARHPELLTQIAGDLLLEKWSGGRVAVPCLCLPLASDATVCCRSAQVSHLCSALSCLHLI